MGYATMIENRSAIQPSSRDAVQLHLSVTPLLQHLRFVALLFLAIFVVTKSPADTPLPPPEFATQASIDFRFVAESDPKTNETIVYRQNRGPDREVLWKFPRWFRAFRLSNEGDALIAETDYLNLLPSSIANDSYPLLTFIVRGKVIREITIKQLLGSRSNLQPTASHLLWGRGLYGIDRNGFAFVDTVVGFFIFDARTGKCVFPPNNDIDPL